MSLNEELKKHQSATLRSYAENDPYLEALRAYTENNSRRAHKVVTKDKLLTKKPMLMPPKKV